MPQTQLLRPAETRSYTHKPLHSLNTREQVMELRSADLSMTMSEIANSLGISRQRVFQILRDEGLPTKRYIKLKKRLYQCLVCGRISPREFCSDECKKKWHQIPIVCTRCGKLFFRNVTHLLHNYRQHNHGLFCGRRCATKWSGKQLKLRPHLTR